MRTKDRCNRRLSPYHYYLPASYQQVQLQLPLPLLPLCCCCLHFHDSSRVSLSGPAWVLAGVRTKKDGCVGPKFSTAAAHVTFSSSQRRVPEQYSALSAVIERCPIELKRPISFSSRKTPKKKKGKNHAGKVPKRSHPRRQARRPQERRAGYIPRW